ncbi:C1 family peptidase [uncultured Tenacibaculum sp.]|uniref:C1 family peptidase n=1 Tax=uncultured Tenacibaculum sp. TaxID=174713 RepID=UPI00260E0693|nr:C1 family peptidase [uncultured Tenacibaculum sp.]
MKKTLFLLSIFLLNFLSIFSQTNLPCQFSWENVATNNGYKKFITNPIAQPFNGPCMSYAVSSAIESMYMIEHNTTQAIKIYPAYLDIKVWEGEFHQYKEVLESGFLIPSKLGTSALKNEYISSNDRSNDPKYVGIRNPNPATGVTPLKCVNEQKDFLLTSVENNGKVFNFNNCGQNIKNNTYLSVTSLIEINKINVVNTNYLKNLILNKPVIIKVNNTLNNNTYTLAKFRKDDYTHEELQKTGFHAYLLIGWENIGNQTSWILKDSWRNKSKIIKTHPSILSDNDFLSMISNGTIQLAQVEGVKKNNISSTSTPFQVNPSIQCPPFSLNGTLVVDLHYAHIGGILYSKAFINSTTLVDEWQWNFNVPTYNRNQINTNYSSSILISPKTSGIVKVKVRGRRGNSWSEWKELNIYISNGGGFPGVMH